MPPVAVYTCQCSENELAMRKKLIPCGFVLAWICMFRYFYEFIIISLVSIFLLCCRLPSLHSIPVILWHTLIVYTPLIEFLPGYR
jgi:hypothetical protein